MAMTNVLPFDFPTMSAAHSAASWSLHGPLERIRDRNLTLISVNSDGLST
jgi:hypothetical protein